MLSGCLAEEMGDALQNGCLSWQARHARPARQARQASLSEKKRFGTSGKAGLGKPIGEEAGGKARLGECAPCRTVLNTQRHGL